MKKQLLLPGLLLAGLHQQPALAQTAPATGAATLHFYQNKAYGWLMPKYRVYADGKLLCKLGRNSHCQVVLPPGATAFTAKIPLFSFGTPPPLTLALEAGKDYYLQGDVAPAGVGLPGLSYGFTEVVANPSKLAQIAQARPKQPIAVSGK